MARKNQRMILDNKSCSGAIGCMAEIYEQLRKAIRAGGKSRYKLWQETGIDQGQLAQFMAGESGLSVESTERLIEALELEVIIRPKEAGPKSAEKRGKRGKRNQ